MYYYIIEQAHSGMQRRAIEKIKDTLGSSGIAGETITPSPARTLEEITTTGIMKGYTTIVAVGGEKLINKVASLLAAEKTKKLVMGIIPMEKASIVETIIGTTDVNTACQALRERKLEQIDLAFIEPNKYFLSPAIIKTEKSLLANIKLDEAMIEATFSEIKITNDLYLEIHDRNYQPNAFSKTFNWIFGRKTQSIDSSYFRAKKLKITTAEPISISIAGDVIAKTPINVSIRSKALTLIVARDRIVNREKAKSL